MNDFYRTVGWKIISLGHYKYCITPATIPYNNLCHDVAMDIMCLELLEKGN